MKHDAVKRIWFLQLSRALASLIIIYVHWITFIYSPNHLQKILHLNPINIYPRNNAIEAFLIFMNTHLPLHFSDGYFALGIFFLISGYLIPLSLEKTSPLDFLIRRIFRVYPTLLVCMAIVICFLSLGRMTQHLPVTVYHLKTIASNALLIRNFFHHEHIEPVLWTLEIEIHFYFIFFLLAFFEGQKKARILIMLPIILAFLSHINAVYINFMLIGTCLFNWQEKNWNGKKTFYMVFALIILDNYFLLHFKQMIDLGPVLFLNHLFVLAFFFILLLLNNKLPYSKLLNTIANISYPLYIMHSITGYITYFIVYQWLHSCILATMIAFTVIITLTRWIHFKIELPSIQLAKKIIAYRKNKQWQTALALENQV